MHTDGMNQPVRQDEVVIVWAKPCELADTVISRSNLTVTFKVPSFKTGKMLYAKSADECAFYRRVEADSSVKEILPRPATIIYLDDGIARKHVPNCLVIKKTTAKTFIEILLTNDPKLLEPYRRAELLAACLVKQGYGYEVVTSAEIKASPYFDNARTLLRLGRKPVGVMDAETVRQGLLRRHQTTWRDILQGALGPNAPFIVARLILDGVLIFDSSKRLGASTVITPLPATF